MVILPIQAHILVISNPSSGNSCGSQFVKDHILPALAQRHYKYEHHETTGFGSAGIIAADFFKRYVDRGGSIIFIISGGDGTLHEVINGVGCLSVTKIQIVLCPQGTANALYSTLFPPSHKEVMQSYLYQLKSLDAFFSGRSRPLKLTRTRILDSTGVVQQTVLGVVITSAALHASILDTAENLRGRINGIERFKVAAMENITTWYASTVNLAAGSKHYEPKSKMFKPLEGDNISMSGPFAYFISTVNVDRLEPTFVISPLSTLQPAETNEMDVVMVRPLRHPLLSQLSEENRRTFSEVMIRVLQDAYAEGRHINLTYEDVNASGSTENLQGDDETGGVVEYLRCKTWSWIPDIDDAKAHLICVDGTLLRIPNGGLAECEITTASAGSYLVCM